MWWADALSWGLPGGVTSIGANSKKSNNASKPDNGDGMTSGNVIHIPAQTFVETGVLLDDAEQPIYWHEPRDRSGVLLPDSPTLWEVIWENRRRVASFAHTHHRMIEFSQTDETTFTAIERALGRPLRWWIVTQERCSMYWRFRTRWTTGRDWWKEEFRGTEYSMKPQVWTFELRKRSWQDAPVD